MADAGWPSDGHGGVPSNYEQDNNAHARPSIGAVRGRRPPRGSSVLAPGRVHPSDASNLINPTQYTSANAPRDAQAVTDAANVGAAQRAVDAANVGGVAIEAAPRGNLVAQIQAGVGVVANAVGPFVGAHNAAGVVPAGQAPAQLNLGGAVAMVAPPGPALPQPYFDIEAGLSGPPLRRSEFGPFF